MQLPASLRLALIDALEGFLEELSDSPDAELVTTFVIEQLETWADETGFDDITVALEESGALDAPLQEVIENEMASNAEFDFTEEEVIGLLERACDIEWGEDLTEEEDADDDDDL